MSKKSPSEESSQSGIVASYRSAFETHALTCFSAKETIDGISYVNKFVGTDIMGYQYFNVYKKGTYTLLCSKQEATSPTGAISSCSKCGSNDCVAICTK